MELEVVGESVCFGLGDTDFDGDTLGEDDGETLGDTLGVGDTVTTGLFFMML